MYEITFFNPITNYTLIWITLLLSKVILIKDVTIIPKENYN